MSSVASGIHRRGASKSGCAYANVSHRGRVFEDSFLTHACHVDNSTQGTEPPNTSFWQYLGRG